MLIPRFFGLAASSALLAKAVHLTGYEYVVVGSGAGGGPLAARLALAGHKTLLIEAGDDQGANDNYTIPAYSLRSSEDEHMAWNFFVRHYADDDRQKKDFKTTYETSSGALEQYVGQDPPADASIKGVLYPRTGTLGGCTAHNALIAVYPDQSDFENIATLTGDKSWSAENMRKYYVKMEKNQYLTDTQSKDGHGFDGWLETEVAPLSIVTEDTQLYDLLVAGAYALANKTDSTFNAGTLIAADANANTKERDTGNGFYQIPLSTNDHKRTGAREFVVAVRDATNADGSQKYPLDVRMNCHVTKVTFDDSETPVANGVEFLDGAHLYRASPLSKGAAGVAGSASASREVIVAGGAYNSPQILKLSGVGPADELKRFNISVVKDLPGVGTNLQDHYEVSVQGQVAEDFSALDGCTFSFGGQDDPCITRWEHEANSSRGIYSSSGLAAALYYKTSASEGDFDTFMFGGPINFRGYFPNYSYNTTVLHNFFSWAILKSHPRNTAGTVTLASSDPLDVPEIVYNYFDTGSAGYDKDLQAMYEAISLARDAFSRVNITEVLPGPDVKSQEEVEEFVKNTAWGHHASSTCPIGADDDKMAVLDSSFRVRGVKGLRVVDASVYPRVPGTFTAVSTYMVAEKAADVILAELDA
ncbi:GMC oxidoreductase [Aplosporella prunicola CBS 121167]|uniref:GMC oxidoreductase n=1 Tax=Aplosporella prunicola CBS 121167 TaxID=1176127 RepID=A0A6A6BG63_9PEZI|nr:GMC oxidoreductase [Aplosporella prunicola CBS 121167]KAF2143119.1 GMC oxidoreductase [Aplosporella prunicola CBS 121167]